MTLNRISVCILAKNAEATLKKTLDSVRSFPEVLLFDTGSTDATLSIAKSYPNVTIHETPFLGFGALRNKIADMAANDWILALDSDEVLSDELLKEIGNLVLSPEFAYTISRHNFFNGKRIKGCGWNPDRVGRIYHRKTTQFSASEVHESLQTQNVIRLKSPILHTPYRSTADFLSKMQHYSSLYAEQHKGQKKSSFGKAFFHATACFLKSYLLKRGVFDGKEGFIISLHNANTTFYKYLKLIEANRQI